MLKMVQPYFKFKAKEKRPIMTIERSLRLKRSIHNIYSLVAIYDKQ